MEIQMVERTVEMLAQVLKQKQKSEQFISIILERSQPSIPSKYALPLSSPTIATFVDWIFRV